MAPLLFTNSRSRSPQPYRNLITAISTLQHPNQIQIISISDNPEIPNAFPPEQPDLAAAVLAALDSPRGEATPTIHRGLGMLDRLVGFRNQKVGEASPLENRLRSEIEIGLEQVRTGDTIDGETVFANLRTRIDSYREPK